MKPKTEVIPVRADSDLARMIEQASRVTASGSAETIRQGLRLGLPEYVKRLTGRPLETSRR